MHTAQADLVKQSVVREVARDVYIKRRDDRRSLSPALRLARIEVLLDEAIVELSLIKRDVRAELASVREDVRVLIEDAKETG